ncbi:MAG: diaminopimelate epimerase [Verrucomicrobiota bacterium]
MLYFTKMNGAGNDFVMIDNRLNVFQLSTTQIAQICDRNRGVGADGLIAVEPTQTTAHFRMRYYNADGSEAEMCGNGARCFARFAQKITAQSGPIHFETLAGEIVGHCIGDLVQIHMSLPHSLTLNTPLQVAHHSLTVHSVNTGVPHAVVFVDDLPSTPVRELGHALRHHPHFAPKGTNANFASILSPSSIAIRTYERGVEDETLACGTGMVAAALLFHEQTNAPSPIQVLVKGGDTLEVGFVKSSNSYSQITLTGPADFVFEGSFPL